MFMKKRLRILFAVLPVLAMAAAGVTYIKSLFYNFHNDTVPLISIGFSCVLSLLCIVLLAFAAMCVFVFLRNGTQSRHDRAVFLGTAFIMNLGFGGHCALVKQSHYALIAGYLAVTSLCYGAAYLLYRSEQNH